ncbi:hypothetical protein BDQ17DRAFT_1544070 [Cyathus striatus]|nr:hypothetical protein BDQ17DRAFT_1544070 [Cyathus striatus]
MFASLTGFTSMLLLATCAATANAALNFTGASWIWSSEAVRGTTVSLPLVQRAFRKDFSTGLLKLPTSVEVIITADDAFTLFINGAQVGSGTNWMVTQFFCVRTTPADIETVFGNRVVIAVEAANTVPSSPAGLLAAVKINYLGGGSDQFVTDASWVSNENVESDSRISIWMIVVGLLQSSRNLLEEVLGVFFRRPPIRLVPLRKNTC